MQQRVTELMVQSCAYPLLPHVHKQIWEILAFPSKLNSSTEPFLFTFSIMVYYKILSTVPHALQQDLVVNRVISDCAARVLVCIQAVLPLLYKLQASFYLHYLIFLMGKMEKITALTAQDCLKALNKFMNCLEQCQSIVSAQEALVVLIVVHINHSFSSVLYFSQIAPSQCLLIFQLFYLEYQFILVLSSHLKSFQGRDNVLLYFFYVAKYGLTQHLMQHRDSVNIVFFADSLRMSGNWYLFYLFR